MSRFLLICVRIVLLNFGLLYNIEAKPIKHPTVAVPQPITIKIYSDHPIFNFSEYDVGPIGENVYWYKIESRPNDLIGIDWKTCDLHYYSQIIDYNGEFRGIQNFNLNSFVKTNEECRHFISDVWSRASHDYPVSIGLNNVSKKVLMHKKIWRFEYGAKYVLVKRLHLQQIKFKNNVIFQD